MRPDTTSGPPPIKGARPDAPESTRTTGTASVADTTDRLRALVAQAAALVAEICDQAERDRQSWDAGYREAAALFFAHGVSVGYAQAEEDMARAWRPVAEGVRDLPRLMDVEERRYPGYTPERLAELRRAARERFGLPSTPREDA